MNRSDAPSFVITAELDDASFEWLNGLRRRYFPAERNVLAAHLTLFHQVDETGLERIAHALRMTPSAPIALKFSALRKLGRGVAISIEAPALQQLHAALSAALAGRLTRQDGQAFRPHVTIQNKVDPAAANALYHMLKADFAPRDGASSAIQIWEYLGGPWRFVARRPLAAAAE